MISVINPGVNKRIPAIRRIKPFEININGLLFLFIKPLITSLPWLFTNKEPNTAVSIIRLMVKIVPNMSFILKKTNSSRIGSNKNNKNHFIKFKLLFRILMLDNL